MSDDEDKPTKKKKTTGPKVVVKDSLEDLIDFVLNPNCIHYLAYNLV